MSLDIFNPDGCLHPGQHCAPLNCPDCGRFSRHSFDTGPFYTENGFQQCWGGDCSQCGEWSNEAS